MFQDRDTCEFNLWAPKAKEIKFLNISAGEEVLMEKQEFGYWQTVLENIPPGTRYKYLVNSAQSYPDPASLSQPDGVHGASEIINLYDFVWTDGKWKNIPLREMILYELHTGTFTPSGNFRGILGKLEYLKELGINAIELMPVAQFSGGRNWGYDGVFLFAVHDTYGGARGLMEFVNECHRQGMAVILDVVYNHLGPEGNYAPVYGYYDCGRNSTPWGNSMNFDGPYSDGVRNFLIQNVLMWCRDFHMDGLRIDAVHAIYDFGAKHILQELAQNLKQLSLEMGKSYHTIAESNLNDVKYISTFEEGGYGLDAQWSDDFHHSVHALTTGERTGYYVDFGEPWQLAKSMEEAFVFDGVYSEFRKKTFGNSTKRNDAGQFVIFSQNHDQTGNRQQGERLISLTDFETAKLVSGTLFVSPYVPMLFMGEEYAERNPFLYFVSHLDPELNQRVKEGREKEFRELGHEVAEMNDPSLPETFKRSMLSWNIDQNPEKRQMFAYYKDLINLRKNLPALQLPDKKNLRISHQDKLIIMERWQDQDIVLAVMNYDHRDRHTVIPKESPSDMVKLIDSADYRTEGRESRSPDKISGNEPITVREKSIVIYSNTKL